jgi:23S rRNA pseudouridine955/2504/2580 synthase
MLEINNPRMQVRHITVDAERGGQRLDNWLLHELKGVPRAWVYRVLRTGQVRVNKGRVKPSYRLQEGDLVRIPPVRQAETADPGQAPASQLETLEAAILYEDQRLLVINKPAGMAVHGGSGISHGVIEGMRALRPRDANLELVHRLDRDTSGCLLISKRRSMLRWLHEIIRENGVDKRYTALLSGVWHEKSDIVSVNQPLKKNILKSGERMVTLDPHGKPSRTDFHRLRDLGQATLVEAHLLTGRTHQIRVHAQSMAMPILGDQKYGDREANARLRKIGLKRLFLHASTLTFELPDGAGRFHIAAPLSDELQKILAKLSVTK